MILRALGMRQHNMATLQQVGVQVAGQRRTFEQRRRLD